MNAHVAAWRLISSALFDGGAEDRAELERWLRSPELSWPQVVKLAGAQFVTPGLWLALLAARVDGTLPDDARHYFQALYEMNRRRNMALLAQIDEAVDALNASGITPLLLKGGAYLTLGIYRDPGARVLADIDALVPPDRAEAARRALARIGYAPVPRDTRRSDHHHLVPLMRAGSPGQIELHIEAVSASVQAALPTTDAWRHSTYEASGRFSVLSPSHTILHRFIHDQIVDRYEAQRQMPLRSLLDLVALDAYYGHDVDWEEIRERACGAGLGPSLANFLYAASRTAGLKLRLNLDFGARQAVHLLLCKSVVRWNFARAAFATLDELSVFRIKKRYGQTQTFASLNAHRVRTVAQILRRHWAASKRARAAARAARALG